MLLELAVGDAYGAGFEYVAKERIRKYNTARRYSQHPKHDIRPGCYTDDTQMSVAVAEALVSRDRWTPRLLAEHIVQAFRRDPRRGYANRFYDFLQQVGDGEQFLQ